MHKNNEVPDINNQADENEEPNAGNREENQRTPAGAAQAIKTPEVELAELKDKYLRLYSEFDNFKRRTSKERMELIKTAGEDIVSAILPVLDDFDRALKSINTSNDIQALKEGINLVHTKFKTIMQQKGLEEMVSLHTPFNADLHEAVTNIPAPAEELKGKVVDELEKGYSLNGKVIRYAKVIVGN